MNAKAVEGGATMRHSLVDMERMRAARQRLAHVRQRIRRLSWLARQPQDLDADVPLLSRSAFVRALARFQAIRLREEKASLLVLRLGSDDLALRRAVAMHLLENTRNCDTLGCADARTFLVLLKGADEKGGRVAAMRLHDEIRRLAARLGHLLPVRVHCLPMANAPGAAEVMRAVDALKHAQGAADIAWAAGPRETSPSRHA